MSRAVEKLMKLANRIENKYIVKLADADDDYLKEQIINKTSHGAFKVEGTPFQDALKKYNISANLVVKVPKLFSISVDNFQFNENADINVQKKFEHIPKQIEEYLKSQPDLIPKTKTEFTLLF